MNRILGLLRDAWWLVALALLLTIIYAVCFEPFVGLAIPIFVIPSLLYFAYIRYDANGNRIEKTESNRDE
ncbi:MAG: hypothetical protein AB7N71_03685 [Phycisphaerae bacterium]